MGEENLAAEEFDLRRIVRETFVNHVEYHARLESTNSRALEMVIDNTAATPWLVLTAVQLGGRGRGDSRWWSGDGALTFSLVVQSSAENLPVEHWPRASLTAGLAVCETLCRLLPPERDLRLKWPNDVYLDGRKLSGILVETSPHRAGALVIGVGINVNNSLNDAPVELQTTAISLVDAVGQRFQRTQLLIHLLHSFSDHLAELARDDLCLSERWRARCLLEGRTVCLEIGRKEAVGVCQGIDDQGALILQTESGIQRFFGGTIKQIL